MQESKEEQSTRLAGLQYKAQPRLKSSWDYEDVVNQEMSVSGQPAAY